MSGEASPYVGDVIDRAMTRASATIVILSPDEVCHLRKEFAAGDHEAAPGFQPRQNVVFEAGMAIGKFPSRTLLVQIGQIREISDISGRHMVRFDDSLASRKAVADRLKNAGCDVDMTGDDWTSAGKFDPQWFRSIDTSD